MLNEYTIGIWVAATIMASFAFILSLSNQKPATRVAVIFTLLAAAWAYGVGAFYLATTPEAALPWIIYNHFMGTAIATSFFYLGFLLNWNKWPPRTLSLSVVTTLALIGLSYIAINQGLVVDVFIDPLYITGRTWHYGPLVYVHYSYFIGMFAAGVFVLNRHARYVSSRERSYIKTMYRASLIGLLPIVVIVFVLRFFGFVNLLWAAPFFALGWILLASYALIAFNIQSIRLFIAEVFVLTMVVLLFANIFITEAVFTELAKVFIFLVFTVFGLLFLGQVSKSERQRKELITLNKKLRNATDRLAEANFKLKGLNEQKTQFISFASHQIKNPLSSILGYASLIEEGSLGKVNKKVYDAVQTIVGSSKHLVRTVEDFLDVSRAELGQLSLVKHDTPLIDLVSSIVSLLSVDAQKKDISLTVNAPNEPLVVLADQEKLRNALYNIIENAVKYTNKGSVTITLEHDNDMATITIEDTGIGMTQEDIAHAFDRFYRAHNSRGTKGSGLGLYLAKDIIERHTGSVTATSKGPDTGTTFTVTLPISEYTI